MLSSLSSGKPTMKGKCPAMPYFSIFSAVSYTCSILMSLRDALQYLVGAGLDADQQPAQSRLLAARPDRIRQPHALIGAHGGRPGDLHSGLDDSIGQRLDPIVPW